MPLLVRVVFVVRAGYRWKVGIESAGTVTAWIEIGGIIISPSATGERDNRHVAVESRPRTVNSPRLTLISLSYRRLISSVTGL